MAGEFQISLMWSQLGVSKPPVHCLSLLKITFGVSSWSLESEVAYQPHQAMAKLEEEESAS